MVAKVRTSTDAVETLRALEEKACELDFFTVLRYLECTHSDQPRLGEAARPADEPVRLTQEPSLGFAPSTLAAFRAGRRGEPHYLSAYFLGLFGPQGPLPLHLTEYVRDREHNEEDPALRRFTDLFHHRLLLLFYRAWANASPATSLDRPEPRRFDTYVGSVIGLGPELHARDAVPAAAKLHLAGLLGLKTRPAQAIVAALKEFFRLPFRIKEFVGSWVTLAVQDHSRLGARPSVSTLGVNAVLGNAVWSCQHRFRLICGPLSFADFKRLLPGRESLERLRDLVRSTVGEEFEWDVNLLLRAPEVPALQLGVAGQLGWTTWLGERSTSDDAEEVIINPSAIINQLQRVTE